MRVFGIRFPKLRLIADWKTIAKLPSMWLAGIASAVVGFILANPTFLFAFIAFFPPERQLVSAIFVAMFTLFLIAATRLIAFDWNHETEAPADDSSSDAEQAQPSQPA